MKQGAVVALVVIASLPLTGCIGAPLVMALQAAAAAATIADKVVGIDVSLRQDQPNKTPLSAVLAPR